MTPVGIGESHKKSAPWNYCSSCTLRVCQVATVSLFAAAGLAGLVLQSTLPFPYGLVAMGTTPLSWTAMLLAGKGFQVLISRHTGDLNLCQTV